VSKRLLYLEKITSDGTADSFAWYALALEYKGLGRVDDALATFAKLREKDAKYVPMYLMCGTMLVDAGRRDDARAWLLQGREVAVEAGDLKARGEIDDALSQVSDPA
jgi:tetratricopeptide (TPR) repeat protein